MKIILRHKILTTVILLIVAIVGFVLFTAVWAYFETPEVIKRINDSGKMTLTVEDLPEDFQTSLLKIEDPTFYSHHGIDLTTPGAGWTTITQGLVKIYFFDNFSKGVINKLKQSIIAVVFDSRVDKKIQLAIFLNSVYLGSQDGRDVIGFQDGAKTYFNKDFSQLSKNEFLQLSAIIVAPNDFELKRHANENRQRVNRIKKFLDGSCQPNGMSDVFYENCGE